jgi:hypothetical protein
MRQKLGAAARLLAALIPMAYLLSPFAAASEPRPVPLETFRVLFVEGTATPLSSGESGDRNDMAAAHMSRVIADWAGLPGLRFIFVGVRSNLCAGRADCSPEQLLWQRMNEASVLLRKSAGGRSIRPDRIGMAFQDEFRTPPELLPPLAQTGSIELRSYVDRPERTKDTDNPCPWRVHLFEPDLPPVIGQVDGRPALPVPTGYSATISRHALVGVVEAGGRKVRPTLIWENDRQEFRSAGPALLTSKGDRVPANAHRLHLLAPPPTDRELGLFLKQLTGEFRPVPRVPLILQEAIARSRDMGDDVQLLRPGALHRPASVNLGAEHCSIAFVSAAAR